MQWWGELTLSYPVCLTQGAPELLHCCCVQKTRICCTDRRYDCSTERLAHTAAFELALVVRYKSHRRLDTPRFFFLYDNCT